MALSNWYKTSGGWFEERTSTNGGMAYSVYIPKNGVNSNTKILVFSCNPNNYNLEWLKYIKAHQDDNCIYMVIPSIQDSQKNAASFFSSRLLDITSAYNIPTENIDMFSWSNGNKGTSAIATDLNGKGYTIGRFVNVFGNFDGTHSSTFFSNFQTGKSSAFPYIYIDDGSNHTNYNSFKNNCDDYIVIKINNPYNHHFYTADKTFNLVDFFVRGEDFKGQYTITRYINGNAVKMSYEEFQKLVNTGTVESLYEKYNELSDFAEFFNGGTGDTLASNLAFVSNSMNGLKSKITSHQDINYTASKTGEAGIVGTIYSATNYYGTVTNLLYGNLSAEADAVYGIANAIYQMDGFAGVMADSTLSDGMSSLYNPSNPAVAEQLNKLKSASANLLDTARSAVMANGRYDELTNVLGTKTTAGGVGKVSISSLESAVNSLVPALNNEIDVASGLKSGVTDFMSKIGSSNILQGGVWEDVKTNMANYENLLDANMKASTFLSDTIKTAMGIVTDYIQEAGNEISAVGALADYGGLATAGELDDTKLPELTAALTEMQTKIDETDAKVKELEASRHMVDDGYTDPETGEFVKTGEHQEPSEEEIQPYRDQLEKYKQIKQTLDEYREVLEGLAPVVQAAQDIIQDAVNQVKDMYENPVQDTDGNITFNTDFKLDLSPYSDYIDTSKDYKQLINDYYDKLNPPAPDPTVENPDGNEDAGDNGEDYDGGDYPSGGGNPSGGGDGGSSGGSRPDTPTIPTDPPTEPLTQPKTEPRTEVRTEARTETPQEKPTEVSPEKTTEGQDTVVVLIDEEEHEGKTPSPNKGGGGGKYKATPLTTKETKEVVPEADETVVDSVIEEPQIDEYTEQPLIKPEDIPEIEEKVAVVKNKDNSLKTMGIASGIGVLLGSAALGAHTIMKNQEEDESSEDYGYDK
jgi:hypothetical protein